MIRNFISFVRLKSEIPFYSEVPVNFTLTRRTVGNNNMSDKSNSGPIENAIREALTDGLNPTHLEVINESYMHGVPKGSESHFKVLVVSQKFENTPLIKQHRMVNDLVMGKLKSDFVHALSIVTKTPAQYNPSYEVEPSPNCRGGFGK
ncbi:bolA-like protein DDB_G0274169 [Condylostylus longicornis]|uniref:bolA-like protein DDB_G0274169 n=1 Tax=Condylostylus longicornis TaxID=2530218 RepID=UPI00244E253A|nr:bolA-like protein DDB_G0274169 [Condylostylus longicornis]